MRQSPGVIVVEGVSNLAGHDVAPTLVLNPADDTDFAVWVEQVLGGRLTTPEHLEARLRERYPAAVVRRRGLSAEPVEVWYVYRDGHWVPAGRGEG